MLSLYQTQGCKINYKGHTFFNTLAFLPVAAVAYTQNAPNDIAIPIAIGYAFGTLYLSPDLDVFSQPYKNWGRLRFIWWPYQKIISHRSKLSHKPIVGTTFRLLYLFFILSLLIIGFNYLLQYLLERAPDTIPESLKVLEKVDPNNWTKKQILFLVFFSIGAELSSIMHLFGDRLYKYIKRL